MSTDPNTVCRISCLYRYSTAKEDLIFSKPERLVKAVKGSGLGVTAWTGELRPKKSCPADTTSP